MYLYKKKNYPSLDNISIIKLLLLALKQSVGRVQTTNTLNLVQACPGNVLNNQDFDTKGNNSKERALTNDIIFNSA